MSRILTIADQSLLDNILDQLPEFKHMESVSYLVSVYGTENESEYFDVKEMYPNDLGDLDFSSEDVREEYCLDDIYGTEDCYHTYGTDLLDEFVKNGWNYYDLCDLIKDKYKEKGEM